jgi:hypothetical protein
MTDASATDELAIELSKSKIVLMIVGAFGFIAIGAWMSLEDAQSIARDTPIFDPQLVHGVGIAGIVFSSLGVILATKKLFDKRPGLVLNSAGIIDNSSGVAAGFIPWSEIVGAEIFEVHRQKMLIITLRDPEKYIARGNLFKRIASKTGYKMCGSPISITSTTLKISFPELLATFEQYHRKYGQSMKASV